MPLVFWAPSVGEIDRYNECANIARRLGDDYTFAGFLPRPDLGEISTLVDHCVRLIRERQARGPYAFIGYCHCGHIAFEIACRLQELGEVVEPLLIIDSSALEFQLNRRQKIFRQIDNFRGPWSVLYPRICSALSRKLRKLIGGEVLEKVWVQEPRSRVHSAAVRRHRAGYFRGRMVLLRSAELSSWTRSPSYGWDALACEVDIVTLPGRHQDMMMGECVEMIVAKIGEELARASAVYSVPNDLGT